MLSCEDIRDFFCQLCTKRFRTKNEWERHTNGVHLKLKNFKCEKCPKAYTDATPLNYHIYTAHGDGSNLFGCSNCEKKFTSKRNRDKHELVHSTVTWCQIILQFQWNFEFSCFGPSILLLLLNMHLLSFDKEIVWCIVCPCMYVFMLSTLVRVDCSPDLKMFPPLANIQQ